MFKKIIIFLLILSGSIALTGCQTTQGNTGRFTSFSYPAQEAQWIRQGSPIKFEGELWYPTDGIEVFLDSEMLLLGTYHGVEFFVDRADVRPFDRLYTKFGKNEFRYFEKRDR